MQELFDVRDKVTLITGGSRGIGRMIAEGYVRAGARVYIAARTKQQLDTSVAELSQQGACEGICADVSTQDGCQALAGEISRREDHLDILVNNAGVTWIDPIEDYPADKWELVLSVNVNSVFFLTQALLGPLRRAASDQNPARVINIGSIGGLRPPRTEWYAYSTSKAAVHHLTLHLAKRLAADLITVNAIAPGVFESEMTEFMFEDLSSRASEVFPLKRPGRPSDVAGVAIFLASRAGAYLTGSVIPVDGGVATLR